METIKNPGFNFPVSGLAAIIVTGVLLIFIAGLTHFEKPSSPNYNPHPVFITHTQPPELLEPAEEEEITPKPLDPAKRDDHPDKMPKPEITFQGISEGISSPGDIVIPVIPRENQAPLRPDIEIFNPTQVDRPPRILRPVTPVYPFDAKMKGIHGRVVLRFVVDEDGRVQNPEVIKANPEGVFEEAALTAIVKYKFAPALIGSKRVKCFAVLPIGFRLN